MIQDVVGVHGSSENMVTNENLEFHVQGRVEPTGPFWRPLPRPGAREL